MDCLFFNGKFGYLEGVVRGLKSLMLTRTDYENLVQGENLDGDDAPYVSNLPSPFTVSMLEEKLKEKLVKEFYYLRNNSYEPLSTFLDYITYGYMIDNVCLLINGTLHNRPVVELLPRCHPLGLFDQIPTIGIVSTPSELYNMILVDTPLAKFFSSCISEEQFEETHVELIRSSVYKVYLEDFYRLCKKIGGFTFEVMKEILEFEADRRAFSITINSFGTYLNKDDRSKFFPTCGKLYPDGLAKLAAVDKIEQIKDIAKFYPVDFFLIKEYEPLFADQSSYYYGKTIEDKFYEHEAKINAKTFFTLFGFGIFYAYVKLSEQQNRNIIWISECIAQNNKKQINDYINIF